MATAMTCEQLMQMQASGRVYQERYDTVLQPCDQRAPAPTLGEDIDTYRRNTLVKIKRLLPDNHELRRIQKRQMSNDALNVFELQLLKACRAEANNAASVPPRADIQTLRYRTPYWPVNLSPESRGTNCAKKHTKIWKAGSLTLVQVDECRTTYV